MQTIPAKAILGKARSPDEWFGAVYNMNLYRGCMHGCIYCDSRSECYQNPDFETIYAKENALATLRANLRSRTQPGIVATGSMSDPYNPFEEEERLTRGALDLLRAFGFGAAIATKSALVARDIDLLQAIAQTAPVVVKLTVTAADDALCRKIEPNVSTSAQRFDALAKLAAAGVFCGVLMTPLLPFLTDTPENTLAIVDRAKEAGARFVYPAFGLTLRAGNREYFYDRLDENFPGLRQRYVAQYGNQYWCPSPQGTELFHLFAERCERLGLLHKMPDIVAAIKSGYGSEQISLWDALG